MDGNILEGKECYKDKINEILKKIENPQIIKLIYGFAKSGYEEEKAGRR